MSAPAVADETRAWVSSHRFVETCPSGSTPVTWTARTPSTVTACTWSPTATRAVTSSGATPVGTPLQNPPADRSANSLAACPSTPISSAARPAGSRVGVEVMAPP
jgi:hypothetical protein